MAFGKFLIAETLQIRPPDRSCAIRFQYVEAVDDAAGLGLGEDLAFGVRAMGWQARDGVVVGRIRVRADMRVAPRFGARAKPVERDISGNRHKPSHGRTTAGVELCGTLPDTDINVLKRIFDL